jgi:hypothetical protein
MGDTFGAAALTLETPVAGEAAGDPGLSRIANYLQACINADAATDFHTVFPETAFPNVVRHAFTHDPRRFVLNDKVLPSLYLFRTGGNRVERLSEDIDLSHDTLQLFWILPDKAQERQRDRVTLFSRIHKQIAHAIELGRHPAYVMAGDADETAASLGSVIYRVAGIYSIVCGAWECQPIQIHVVDEKTDRKSASFEKLGVQFELAEQRTLDIVADFPAIQGADLTITTPDRARDLAVAKL